MSNFSKNAKTFSKNCKKFINKHSQEILIGCGITGFISSIIMTAKQAPKAQKALDNLHHDLAILDEDLSKGRIIFEEVKTAAPYYVGPVITAGVSTACIFGSYKIGTKKAAALATAYEISQSRLIEYKDKVEEKFGEKKAKEVEHEIHEDRMKKDPPKDSSMMTDGKSWFQFECDGTYFRSSRDDILNALKRIESLKYSESFIPLNELKYELDIDSRERARFGDENGWVVIDPSITIDVQYDSCIAPNGESCQVISFYPDITQNPENICKGLL